MQEQTNQTPNPPSIRKNKRWPWVAAVIFTLLVIAGAMNDKKAKVVIPEVPKNITVAQSPKPPEEKSFNIVVTSQIVKKIDGKYRYFFDIRNDDSKDFSGTVKISIINKLGKEVYYDIFDASTTPIIPKMGDTVYFDANTGPESVHGDSGITQFSFEVKVAGSVVKTGNGYVVTRIEN